MKLLHIIYNLFAETEMLSLTVYEPIAIQILLRGPFPNLAEGRARGSGVVPHETPLSRSAVLSYAVMPSDYDLTV